MKTFVDFLQRSAATAVVVTFCTSCLTYNELTWDAPPEVSLIKVGASRETVERELGKPTRRESNVYTYEYNTRLFNEHPQVTEKRTSDLIWTTILDVGSLGTTAFYGPGIEHDKEAQKAELAVVYAPNGTVLDTFDPLQSDRSSRRGAALFQTWRESSASLEGLRSLCLSANHGYAPAQFAQAMRYRSGADTETDEVKAYLWARLAAFGGHPGAEETAQVWASNMKAEDVEIGERLFTQFEPEVCE